MKSWVLSPELGKRERGKERWRGRGEKKGEEKKNGGGGKWEEP